jgi:hypothetical protein
VVDESVDHGSGDDLVAEDFAATAERLVGGDDQAGALIAAGDELEEQVGCFGFERDVADFVEYDQRVADEPARFGLQPSAAVCVGEPVDPLAGGGEQHPMPGLAAADRESDPQVGLPVHGATGR